MSRRWLGLLGAAAALLALAALLASCSDTEEEVAPGTVATASPAATTAGSTTPAGATPIPVPSGWKSYTDPALGFSFQYPGDLAVTDKGSSSPTGGERDLEFRSAEVPPRLVLVIAMVENDRGLTLGQWVFEYAACLPETIKQGTAGGLEAIFCTSEPGEIPEPAVAFEHKGTMFLIRSLMPSTQFDFFIASLRL